MAADFPEIDAMQRALGVKEFDDFEVTEVDGAILWDLLEELESQEKGDKSELIDHNEPDHAMTNAEEGAVEKSQASVPDSNSKWVTMDDDVMVETDPLREIEGWFTDDMVGMIDFGYTVGDYSQLHSGVGASSNEIPYSCLWEN